MSDIVYVLTNAAMPGLVKIGYTSQAEAQTRIAQLYSTGVPVPFDVAFAATVESAEKVEEALHTAFGPSRINSKREFFRIDPEQAIAILRLFQKDHDAAVIPAIEEQLRKKGPNMNFQEMGIPVGALLRYTRNNTTVTVSGPKKVKLGDEEMPLTAATRQLLQIDYNPSPRLYWTYNGRLLLDVYKETYESTD